MKKMIAGLLCGCMIAASLTGCGKAPASDGGATEKAAGAEAEKAADKTEASSDSGSKVINVWSFTDEVDLYKRQVELLFPMCWSVSDLTASLF